MKRVWVYDLETFPNIFAATFIDAKSDDVKTFILTEHTNQLTELLTFLETEVLGLIGYNCLTFDAQIIEFLFRNRFKKLTSLIIQHYAQIITSDKSRKPDIPFWKLRIPHLDLFRALSLSVKTKMTGLKWTEYMLDAENIEDLPSQGEGNTWIEQVLAYNFNDVINTKKLYILYYSAIEIRKKFGSDENIDIMNSTEPDISKKLLAVYLSKAMGISTSQLYGMRTIRDIIEIKDVFINSDKIIPKSKILLDVYNFFKNLVVSEEEVSNENIDEDTDKDIDNEKKYSKKVYFGGINIIYALGGIHGSLKSSIVESNEEYIIKSTDVVSFYPNIGIKNKLHPAHIPQDVFINIQESIFNRRQSIPKSEPANYILKIALNAIYGMSNDEFSFLKDRHYTLAICINGQLLLTTLFEEVINRIPNSKLIMCNTDGFEVLIPREYENLYYEICKQWEEDTKLSLEFANYSKMVVSDVNNYLAIYENGKTKCKGRYEFENIPLHKNKSHNIIPIAIYNYFVKNIPIEETIYNHRNIFDFCAGVKASKSPVYGEMWYELRKIEKDTVKKIKLSKTVRYYISKQGFYLFKLSSNSISHVEAPYKSGAITKDWKVTYFNKAKIKQDFNDYDIDYSYYLHNTRKWINSFNLTQTKLF